MCHLLSPPKSNADPHAHLFFFVFFTNTTIRHNTLLRSETSYCNVISASAFLIQPEWIFGWFKKVFGKFGYNGGEKLGHGGTRSTLRVSQFTFQQQPQVELLETRQAVFFFVFFPSFIFIIQRQRQQRLLWDPTSDPATNLPRPIELFLVLYIKVSTQTDTEQSNIYYRSFYLVQCPCWTLCY